MLFCAKFAFWVNRNGFLNFIKKCSIPFRNICFLSRKVSHACEQHHLLLMQRTLFKFKNREMDSASDMSRIRFEAKTCFWRFRIFDSFSKTLMSKFNLSYLPRHTCGNLGTSDFIDF